MWHTFAAYNWCESVLMITILPQAFVFGCECRRVGWSPTAASNLHTQPTHSTVGNMHLQNRDISRISLVICKRPNKINNQLSNPNELRHWPFKRCMPFLSPLFACARLRETKKKLFFETFVYIKCCVCLGADPAPIPASPYAFIYNVCIYSVRCTRENRQIRSAVRCSFQ